MLLVDDEIKLLLGLKAIMTREGYEVISAHNGTDGIRLAREHLPDIIICDVMMPAPNGFEVKRILSSELHTASIPFIFLTARTLEADKIAGLKQGADDYITKPFNADELIARVDSLLRRSDITRQLAMDEMEEKIDLVRHSISTNLGHELRTPLAIILASLDMAIREKFTGKNTDLDWYLENSLSSAHKLSMLVNDLILLNSIDQNNLSTFRRRVDLEFNFREPIQNVISRYTQKKLNIQIFIEEGIVLNAPEFEFAHAASHLVDNACKFSPDGASISIQLQKNGDGGCILSVENEGSFIPADLREKVFERYYQVYQGDNRLYGGLGLGLTIARAVAEAAGGSVKIVDSRVGCKVRMIYPPAPANWHPTQEKT